MLGKLIKHEWKNTYKVSGLILIFVAAFTLLGCISLRMPLIHSAMSDTNYSSAFSILDAMGIMSLILYMLTLMGATYGIMIYLGVHFYKSMYTDEGYLTHTLPVSTHQLLISKILVSGIWMMIVMVAIFVSVVALGYAFLCMYLPATPAEITKELGELIVRVMEELPGEYGMGLAHVLITFTLLILVSPFSSIIMLFGAITIGQLFTKYRAMMAIVSYIGICVINMVISSLIQIPITMGYIMRMNDPAGYYMRTYDVSIFMAICMGALLYFLSHFILSKKFNME